MIYRSNTFVGVAGSSSTSSFVKNDSTRNFIGLEILIICIVFLLLVIVIISVYMYNQWQRKKKEEQRSRLMKLFEDDDQLEFDLGVQGL
ncbi:hypothetical protein ACS0TY_037002 [Phlomoides rotata]